MDSLSVAILVFLGSAVVVVIAGTRLARYGDDIAEKTGWGALWVGTILVSIATSLPEVVTNFTAVIIDAPDLALGNVFGANMVNILVISLVAIAFGARNIFGDQPRNTQYLILVAIGVCSIAVFFGWVGGVGLGPTSVAGLAVAVVYLAGMRTVYNAGRSRDEVPEGGALPDVAESPRGAFIGFGLASLAIIIAAPLLANAADSIGRITGLGGSFMGVLAVSLVTTLPEGSVTVAAAYRKSYGLAIGNVYGSCAFNVFILSLSDLANAEPLVDAMMPAHFVAGIGAIVLMSMGFLIVRSFYDRWLSWARALVFVVPPLYVGIVYWVYALGAGSGTP